jgi:hypothetical protein
MIEGIKGAIVYMTVQGITQQEQSSPYKRIEVSEMFGRPAAP